MKAGISIITLALGPARSRSLSRLSLSTLSETLPPSAGHTAATSANSAAASSDAPGASGNTVRRVALTARLRSIIGE